MHVNAFSFPPGGPSVSGQGRCVRGGRQTVKTQTYDDPLRSETILVVITDTEGGAPSESAALSEKQETGF